MVDAIAKGAEESLAGVGATPSPATLSNQTPPLLASAGASNTSHMATRVGFLGIFIVLAFIGNLTLVATVSQSRRLRTTALNLFVVSAACFNLVNCVVNMPLILGAAIKDVWEYGDFMCRVNSAFMHFTKIGILWSLACMTIDRLSAVSHPAKYPERMRRARVNAIIVCSWVHSFVFSVVILIPAERLQSTYYPHQYLCTLAEKSSLLYVVLESVFCFVIPFGIIIAINVYFIQVCARHKLKKKNIVSRQMLETDQQHVWNEVVGAIYVGNLFIFWFIFEGPYVILDYVRLFTHSQEIQDGVGTAHLTLTYPWEVDLAFTWMRLSYPMLLPILTFVWRKEVWKKFKNLVLCRKSNLINDAAPCLSEVAAPQKHVGRLSTRNKKSPQDIKQESYKKTQEHFNVPILFATSNGIHVQTYVQNDLEDTLTDSDVFGTDIQNSKSSGDFRMVKAKKVDVIGSQADMSYLQMDGDTSDYDSQMEMDPFSVSNPISVRSLERHSPSTVPNHVNRMKYLHNQMVHLEEPRSGSAIVEMMEDTHAAEKEKVYDSGIDYKEKMNRESCNSEDSGHALTSNECEERRKMEQQEGPGDDSGTGSVGEQWSQKNKARDFGKKQDDAEKNQTDSITSAGAAKTETAAVNEQKGGDDNASPPSAEKSKKKHKRKKKKSKVVDDKLAENQSANQLDCDNLAGTVQSIDHTGITENDPHSPCGEQTDNYRRRPARLKPLEHKSHIIAGNSALCNNPSSLAQFAHKNNSSVNLPYHSESNHSQGSTTTTASTKTNSELFRVAPLSEGVAVVSSESTSSSKRHRRSTVDSQTALLGGSNSSADLSEMRDINAERQMNEIANADMTVSGDDKKQSKSKKHQRQVKSDSRDQLLVDSAAKSEQIR